jgi:hypothetical protein
LTKKPDRIQAVLTEETLDDIRVRLETSPRKSLKRLAQETGVSIISAQRATKLLKLQPHKTMVVHALKEHDPVARINFCDWFLRSVHDGEADRQLVFFSDEAWFSLCGEVNSQNNWYWSAENPRFIHEFPLHHKRIGVWYAISARSIFGPIFYNDTVNAARYVDNILSPSSAKLTEDKGYTVFSSRILQQLIWRI